MENKENVIVEICYRLEKPDVFAFIANVRICKKKVLIRAFEEAMRSRDEEESRVLLEHYDIAFGEKTNYVLFLHGEFTNLYTDILERKQYLADLFPKLQDWLCEDMASVIFELMYDPVGDDKEMMGFKQAGDSLRLHQGAMERMRVEIQKLKTKIEELESRKTTDDHILKVSARINEYLVAFFNEE